MRDVAPAAASESNATLAGPATMQDVDTAVRKAFQRGEQMGLLGAPWVLGCRRPRTDSLPKIWISALSGLQPCDYSGYWAP